MHFSEDIYNFIQAYLNVRSTLFWRHQKRQLKRYKKFFDSVERQPLTELQRRSVILDEKRNLVVAGAGTGKTSVIVAKVGYLIESEKCKPEDILLLAFNTDAAKELSDRCKERLGAEIQASTFHGLGNQIVGSVEPIVPTLSRLAQDQQFFSQFLDRVIEELKLDKQVWAKARTFILGHLKPYRSESDFKSLADYLAYIRTVELRALSGDLVKSFAELDIANFLFFNGVNFEYEKRYPHEARRYQPDFYLSDYNIWLEHFGIDKNGDTAPYIDRKKYHCEMEWKRNIHAKNNTKLLETYSWQKSEGILTAQLNDLLKKEGVIYKPRSQEEVFAALKKAGYITQLAVLVETFLSHFKSNQMSLLELNRRAENSSNQTRAEAFVELFQFFFEKYQSALRSKNPPEIDFNDMISHATKYVRDGRYYVPWKYIIVDEFQDISYGRYLFLEAMLKSRENLQFFAVGDDWQSIYRFAGSDISIMSKFREFFGRAAIVNLDRTFRFNDKIAAVSGEFIQRNPKQIRKTLVTQTHCEQPQVFMHWVGNESRVSDNAALETVIKTIKSGIEKGNPSLLILARYNHLLPNRAQIVALEKIWPGEIKNPLTVHRSKGLEADYVIIVGLTSNKYGFPSEIDDDPLLGLVLAEPDSYPNAEERRLFYVALTRAKQQVHIIADRIQESSFATELLEKEYEVQHIGRSNEDKSICPECHAGLIIEKKPGFAACSNFPFCEYAAPRCNICETRFMLPSHSEGQEIYQCVSEECPGQTKICPECETGAIIRKNTKYGDMSSCHIWPRCNYIEK